VHGSAGFELGKARAAFAGTLGWRHAFGDGVPQFGLSFAGGDSFIIAGVPLSRNTAVLDAGVDFAVSTTATLGLSYNGQFGSGLTDNGARLAFKMRF
jgi:outer membrane autotransporter protein